MSRNLKPKIFVASSVWLSHVPKAHVAANGSKQFTILAKFGTQAAICEMLGVGRSHMSNFCGIHRAPESVGYGPNLVKVADVAVKEGVIYYEHRGQWYEYKGEND